MADSPVLYIFGGGDGVASISPPCLKVMLALGYVGVEHETVRCTYRQAHAVSPTGKLPVLDMGGERFEDSVRILTALEERYPKLSIPAEDARARRVDRLIEIFINEHVYWQGFYMRWFDPETHRLFLEAITKRMPPLMRAFIRTVGVQSSRRRGRAHGIGGRSPENVRAALRASVDLLAESLEGGPFMQGRNAPARADFACAAVIAQAGFRNTGSAFLGEVQRRPELATHCRRVYKASHQPPPNWLREERV